MKLDYETISPNKGVREAIGPQPELPPSCHRRDSVSPRPVSESDGSLKSKGKLDYPNVAAWRASLLPRQRLLLAAAAAIMLPTSRLKLTELNPNLTCILCAGYFIDATTIVECLHSFCKSCIVKYLVTSKFCPICDVQVHKTKPLLHIRSDKTLQDIVYKLVPKAFITEMKRRKDFYQQQHPDAGRLTSPEDRGECVEQRVIYDADENISLSLEYGYGTNQRPETEEQVQAAEKETNSDDAANRRFLLCKAAVRVSHLKKLINMKYDLNPSYEVDIMYLEEILEDDLSLMDIAYIYSWRRIGPMRLFYRIRRKVKTVAKQCVEEIKEIETTTVTEEPTPMEVEPLPVAEPEIRPPVTEAKPKSSKRSGAMATVVQTVTIVPPVNPATKRSDDSSGQSEPRTKRLCLKVAVNDPAKSPSNALSPTASVTIVSPMSSPSTASSTTSESSSGKSSKHKHKNKDKEGGKSKESKHHSKHKESSKELLRIKEYLRTQELGTKVKDKSREGGKSKEHHHHHHHHKNKDGTKGKSSSKTKDSKVKEAIPKFKMATKLKEIPKLTQTVKIKDMPEIRPVEKEVPVAKEPPIKIKEILKNKEAKYKEVYTFTQNPQKSKEMSIKSKDYIKFRDFPKSSKVKDKKKDKSHKQRRSSATLSIPTEITVTKTFIPPVETLPVIPPREPTPIPEPIAKAVEPEKPEEKDTATEEPTSSRDPCKIKVATLVIPGFTANKPTNSRSLPTSPLYSSLAPPEQVQIPDLVNEKEVLKRPASTPASMAIPEPVGDKVAKVTEESESKTDKEDDAEMPDEADSGRGSDFSSRTEVRSSCDDDIGSPSPTASCSATPTSVATSPPMTVTVTKTITPPVETNVKETNSYKMSESAKDKMVENAKNEALSRKAVVEVKKVDDIRMVVEKRTEKGSSLFGNIKTYSKASYATKDCVVKVTNTGAANPIPSVTVTSSVSKSNSPEPKPIDSIRITLENKIDKVEKKIQEVTKTLAEKAQDKFESAKVPAVTEKPEDPKIDKPSEVPQIPKTITISIKTPCPVIQNKPDEKIVRSPPPPVASPKLAEPPVAAVGITVASAPSASPPTSTTFLQPPLYHSPQHRNSPSSPQYHIYNPHRQFSPPQRGDHHHHGKTPKIKSLTNPHHPALLPLIVKQTPPMGKTALDRKRKDHPCPSTSGMNRSPSPAVSRVAEPAKDNIGALDLSVASRHDRPASAIPNRSRNMVANPPVLDKHRIATCLQAPKVPSLKIIATPTSQTSSPSTSSMNVGASSPASSPSSSSSLVKRSDPSRSYHRASGKNLTVINHPGDIPKLVIKTMPVPSSSGDQHGHHGHHGHHNHHHKS